MLAGLIISCSMVRAIKQHTISRYGFILHYYFPTSDHILSIASSILFSSMYSARIFLLSSVSGVFLPCDERNSAILFFATKLMFNITIFYAFNLYSFHTCNNILKLYKKNINNIVWAHITSLTFLQWVTTCKNFLLLFLPLFTRQSDSVNYVVDSSDYDKHILLIRSSCNPVL